MQHTAKSRHTDLRFLKFQNSWTVWKIGIGVIIFMTSRKVTATDFINQTAREID